VPHYERLSAQDASFLVYEDRDPTAHMHIGGVSIYDGGGLTGPRGGVDIERIRAYVESRLPLIPRYRQRIHYTPLLGDPVWVDDDRFNVRYHVRHTRLPRPGDERELKRLAGRIMSQRLDRNRPLWELWIIEGLGDGRFSMLTKTHHCMIDGVSGVDLSTVLMQLGPDDTFAPPPPWEPRPVPSTLTLIRDELLRRATLPAALLRGAGELVAQVSRGATGVGGTLATVGRLGAIAWRGAARTPLNRPIGPHRRFDWTDVSLDEAKAVKNRLGGKLNDVVLTVVAGAIGAFLRRRRVNVEILDFVTAIPVNTRAEGDTTPGNSVAAWLAVLPIAERDPAERLRKIVEITQALKGSRGPDPTALMYAAADWGGPAAVGLVVRATQTLSPCNLIVTNVPGPPFPLYLLGARMTAAYPLVTLLAEQGLGIAVFSYLGRLRFGFNADWDLLPDLEDLVRLVEDEFARLKQAAGVGEAEPAPVARLHSV